MFSNLCKSFFYNRSFNSFVITGKFTSIMSKKKSTISNLSAKVQVSILGNGALGNPSSVVVNTDTDTYLINCGEGVQRLFYQHKIRIGKIKDVFLTRVAHSNYSGIFGMFLTYDSYFKERGSVPKLFTPPGMDEISTIYTPFIGLVNKFQYEFLGNQSFENENINNADDKVLQTIQSSQDNSCKTIIENIDMTIKSIPIISSSKATDISIAYLFLITDKPGQLNIENCKRLKLPPGPIFAKIKCGEEVEVNGRIIRPSDVLGPPELGGAFIVLECPTIDSVASLIQNETFTEHLENKKLEFIIHITPDDVFNSTSYQTWIQSFGEQTKHLILNSSNTSEMSLNDSSRVQLKLNQVDSTIFPCLKENQSSELDLQSQIIRNIPTMFTINLRPEKTEKFIILPENIKIELKDVVQELEENEDFSKNVQEYKEIFHSNNQCLPETSEEFKKNIVFLGTGSSLPGKLRNTSAILLNIAPGKSAFLDCGEATFMQLCRFYGREQYKDILMSISLIFVSHLHADHHFGIIKILQEISKLLPPNEKKTIVLIAPEEIYTFLKYFNLENIEFFYRHSHSLEKDDVFYGSLEACGIQDITTVPVPHSYQSHGIIVDLNGQKIAYSGDSQYSTSFDNTADGCLLMIHEATMDDDLREDADSKRHSTISDAINVGRNCNAQYTILTHFSQRYAKIPLVNSQDNSDLNSYIQNNVGIAFDFMNIKLQDLRKVGQLKKPLEILFRDDLQNIHNKQVKKNMKRKLIEEQQINILETVSNSG